METASDMSGNGRDGTRHNGAAFQAGVVGQGLYFDGSNDYFSVPTFPMGGEFSISLWAKYDRFRDWDCVMDFANGSTSQNLKINMGNSGSTVRGMIFQMMTTDDYRYSGGQYWILNKWVHTVLTVDKDATIKGYRSGSLIDTQTGSTFADSITRNNHWFGKSTWNDNHFKGKLDEIRLYDRAILAEEALQLALQGNTTPYDLNSSSPLIIAENKQHGTVIGEFNATEPDAWDSVSYELFDNNGSTDNSFFTLDSNGTLKSATTFDYESNPSTYTIQVLAKDDKNATLMETFLITLEDIDERVPVVSNGTVDNITGSEVIIHPAVDLVGGGEITTSPNNDYRGIHLSLYWGSSDGGDRF